MGSRMVHHKVWYAISAAGFAALGAILVLELAGVTEEYAPILAVALLPLLGFVVADLVRSAVARDG